MCVRLDLLAECGRRRLEVSSWFGSVIQVKAEVPGAYDTVSPAGISISMSAHDVRVVASCMLVSGGNAYNTELLVSTARPLTPSLCPPFWLARGRTAHVSRVA
jgi:hypothetical protein